ncbi:MAG: 2-oxoacid:acceptor oxidoreductase family protein, partial [Thermoplasmata archaeon]
MNKDHSCKKRTNILITGVGGQGILLASELIAKTALKANINVVCSEVHGMAQRGGVVESTVRLGDVKSPLIPLGQADVILAFEPVEAARFIHYANPETFIV